jgi:hypothetical protein
VCGVPSNGTFALKDFYTWLTHVGTGRDLTDTHHTFTNTTVMAEYSGSPSAPDRAGSSSTPATNHTALPSAAVVYNCHMPADMEKKEFAVFEMRHVLGKDYKINSMDIDSCNDLLAKLISELNEKFMTDLGFAAVAQQSAAMADTDGDEMLSDYRSVFVGGSHAARMAAAADNLGLDIKNLSVPGFRINPDSIKNAAILLQEAISEETDKHVIVIFQIFDNNTFFTVSQDGCKSLPVGDKADNIYHIPGALEVADHNTVKSLVTQCVPLLRTAGDCEKIVLSPLPRYVKPCCTSKEHLTNRRDAGFKDMMAEGLEEIARSLNDLVAGKKIRSFKVFSPMQLLDSEEDTSEWVKNKKKFWAADPVHMTADGYAELVRVLANAAVNAEYDRVKAPVAAPAPPRRPPKIYKRQGWVSSDDTTAHRVYPQEA